MALIKCPECGKEISDKAPACIHCGCPVSAMKTESEQPVATNGNNVPFGNSEFNAVLGGYFGGATMPASQFAPEHTAPVETVPEEMPEIKMLPGILLAWMEKLSGVIGVAGYGAAITAVANMVIGDVPEEETLAIAFFGIVGNLLFSMLGNFIEFCRAKKFIKKNGYEESIRRDGSNMVNTLNAFGLSRTYAMARYIKTLNPVTGEVLDNALKESRKNKWKKRIGYLPYLAVLTAVFYVLPLHIWTYFDNSTSLAITHVISFLVMCVYGYKKGGEPWLAVIVGLLFAPTILAYYYEDIGYHAFFAAGAAFVGMYVGHYLNAKK